MTYEFEKQAHLDGYKIVCGVDEAGRGPLAGPVYAAAVILPDGLENMGINDSKKISEKKREQIFDTIIENAVAYGIGFATETEIDQINILNATFLAMKRAVENMGVEPDLVLVDGNRKPCTGYEETTIVKGDAKSISISAASILAKVSRDRYMRELAERHPEYEFEKHKGYGTKLHYEKIEQYGILPDHRKSFLKKILDK
ncbi:MAG: ribonuclease HII [Clostridia bacterium]|nr:ribonuclease HII [Clostridia bacterium]